MHCQMRPHEPPVLQPAKFQRNWAMRGWVIAILLIPPRGCLNGATENAGVENAIRSKLQGRKMQEWKKQEQIAGVENAGVENARVDSRSKKRRSKSYGTPNRDYFERILSYLNLVR